MSVFQTTCWLCGRPLVFPFEPRQPKTCDDCYSPRDSTEIQSHVVRHLAEKQMRIFLREEAAGHATPGRAE